MNTIHLTTPSEKYTNEQIEKERAERQQVDALLQSTKQDKLISGENIKTINGEPIIGKGNIDIGRGGTYDYKDLTDKPKINGVELSGNKTAEDLGIITPTKTSELINDSDFVTETKLAIKQDKLISGTNIKTINNETLLGDGNIEIEGSTDYVELVNKPSINGVELNGNKTTTDLGINIPTKVSDLDNDSNFIKDTELSSTIGNHNNDNSAHADIRNLITNEATVREQAISSIEEQLNDKENSSNKVTTILESSTDTQYPSAKAVYSYVSSLIGDIDTVLDAINGEVI